MDKTEGVSVVDWHPTLQSAHEDLHPTVLSTWRECVSSRWADRWHYGNAVCSVVFDWMDGGIPPFATELADALTAEGILSYSDVPYTQESLRKLVQMRALWRPLVAYRRSNNLAYVAAVADRGGKGAKSWWHMAPERIRHH